MFQKFNSKRTYVNLELKDDQKKTKDRDFGALAMTMKRQETKGEK